MKVTAERQADSQVVLEIEVEPERVEKSLDQAYKRIGSRYRIPGFRPGKAPRAVFERIVGRPTLLREALEHLLPEVYEEAIREEGLEPVDQPTFDIPSTEPLKIRATVPLQPSVTLGDYRSLRLEPEPVTVEESEIENALQDLRRRYATLVPVERPAQEGDRVRAVITATVDDRTLVDESDGEVTVSAEALSGLPGLYDQLLGMSKGETKEIDAVVPDDFEDENMRGKTVHYRVTVNEIKEEQLPELDDAFAQDVGEGFSTLAELRARIATDLRQRKEEQAERAFERKLVDALIAGATLEYPPVLVEREIDAMLDEQLGGNRAQLEAALRRSGSSLSTLRERFRPAAVDRVQRSLVLTKVAELEGLSVEASEVDAEIERLASSDPAQAERLRQALNDSATRDLIGRTVLTRKVYQRLKDIATGKEVPPPASAASTTEYNEGSARAEAAETTPPAEASQS